MTLNNKMKLPEEVAALCKMVAEPLCEMRDVLPYKTLFSCVTSINRKLEKRFFNIRAEPYLIDEKSWEQIKDSLKNILNGVKRIILPTLS